MNNINFKIYTSSYDHGDVESLVPQFAAIHPEFLKQLISKNSKLIEKVNNLSLLTGSLSADIIIIEDNIVSILQHFRHITNYIKKYNKTDVKSVIACTKHDSSMAVINNLRLMGNRGQKPKLAILDFDLQEEEDSEGRILQITERIIDSNWQTRFLPVSGFKEKAGRFKEFETYLQIKNFETFEKSILLEDKAMVKRLQYHLDRPKTRTIDKYEDRYAELEEEVGHKKIQSAINLLDRIEAGIIKQNAFDKAFNTANSVLNNKGVLIKAKTSIITQVSKHHKPINLLLEMACSKETARLPNDKWKNLIYQICNHKLFRSQSNSLLKCPKKMTG
jgi:hypothetical protein